MIIWKGKGILIILYFLVCFVVIAIIYGLLKQKFEFLESAPIEVILGLALTSTGLWTKFTSENYFINEEGRKINLDIQNELFFIKMRTWGVILLTCGIGLLAYGVILWML